MRVLPIENYRAYLEDESRLRGTASGIVFPESAEELAEVLREAAKDGLSVTLQGSRTGLWGGAVPDGGLVVSTERMNKIRGFLERDGRLFLRVQAGVTLGEIEKYAQSKAHIFPPDSTEKTATIGGVFATDGTGPQSLFYGAPSQYVESVALVAPDGAVTEIERGAGGGLIDSLAGSVGKLGAFAEFTLALLPAPEYIWGVVCFFSAASGAEAFFSRLWGFGVNSAAKLASAEFFGENALRFCAEERENNSLLKGLPDFPRDAACAVYVELISDDGAALDEALSLQLDLFSACGGAEEDTWAESGLSGIKRFRDMRHAVTETPGGRAGIPNRARIKPETACSGEAERAADYRRMCGDETSWKC